MISPNSIDQLLQLANIEDVVGDYVNLKRSGSRFKGNCPFHDEKTPSFVVTPNLGIYKCFGCQKGGNAIQFIMDIENLTFSESARNLAKRYGIDLVETHSGNRDEELELQREKESLQALNEFTLKFFQDQLLSSDQGKSIAMPYFQERGFTYETIQNWQLGYSPTDWEAFYTHAKKAGYKDELLLKAGLIKKRDKDGSHYDLFRNRVIFPLTAVNGKVVGFAGRIMGKVDNAPKYVNSPETDLYKKSDFLFALAQSKNTIRKENKAYLMEGYTDVITLHQSGITNAVASSGTALTPGQIKLIKRFTDNATVIYDGDNAGIKASLRGINLLLQEGLNVRVVPMPEGEDPDSYCKKLGPTEFKNYLEQNEKNFIFFKAERLLETAKNDPIIKSEAIRDIIESVALINDRLKRDALITELERICEVKVDTLYAELGKQLRKNSLDDKQELLQRVDAIIQHGINEEAAKSLSDIHQEEALLRLLLMYASEIFEGEQTVFDFVIQEYLADPTIHFVHPITKKIMDEMLVQKENEGWPGSTYFINHTDSEVAAFTAAIFSQEYQLSPAFLDNLIYVKTESDNFRSALIDIFLSLRRTKIEELIVAELEKLKIPDQDHEETMEYLNYLNTYKLALAAQIGYVISRF